MIKNFQDIVTQLKTQVPIQELISEFVHVKKSGRGFVALCPFHEDHHPSLQIHPQKGIFKCFACGTGGDLISFYALINKKKWSEAVEELALKYGLKIEYGNISKTEIDVKNQLYELNNTVLDFFRSNLFSTEGKEAFEYLKEKRKLSTDTIEKYKIGYAKNAKNNWDLLFNHLAKTKQLPQELIIASGLFIQRENQDGYYDRFRNRIIFPIFSETGKVIGFGGRTILTSNEEPKYINSPETLIFNKGSNLYGLNIAKDEIKKYNYAILTEGYLDVITAHQHGLLNTVATLGTALTTSQARLLVKHTESKKVCLCLDTDLAGKKAVENIFRLEQEIKNQVTLDLRVVSDLPAKDLDEALNKENVEAIRKKIEEGQKLDHFIIERILAEYNNAKDEISKKQTFERFLEVILLTKDPIEQKENIKYISHKLNLEEELINLKVKEKIKSLKQRAQYVGKSKIIKDEPKEEDDNFKMFLGERFKHAEIELLSLYISLFPNITDIKESLLGIEFTDAKHKLLKDFLDNLTPDELTPQKVIDRLIMEFNEYKHIMSVIADIATKIEIDETNYSKHKDKILKESKEWINWWIKNKQDIKILTEQLKESSDKKNEKEETEILSKMMEVVRRA